MLAVSEYFLAEHWPKVVALCGGRRLTAFAAYDVYILVSCTLVALSSTAMSGLDDKLAREAQLRLTASSQAKVDEKSTFGGMLARAMNYGSVGAAVLGVVQVAAVRDPGIYLLGYALLALVLPIIVLISGFLIGLINERNYRKLRDEPPAWLFSGPDPVRRPTGRKTEESPTKAPWTPWMPPAPPAPRSGLSRQDSVVSVAATDRCTDNCLNFG
jgi:hypothetical protein